MKKDLPDESVEKLSEFRRLRNRPIVFCVECGSLEVEQNSVHALQCLNCRNTLFWNGYRFSIAREAFAEHDAATAFATAKDSEANYQAFYHRDWHFNIFRALWRFSDVANRSFMVSTEDSNVGKSGEEYEELVRAWNKCKEEIDVALSRTMAGKA